MPKKISAVILIETLLLLAAAGIFVASSLLQIDIPAIFGFGSASATVHETDSEWPGFDMPQGTPVPDGIPLRDRAVISADVSLDGARVSVREKILLHESTTFFHGYIFAAGFSGIQINSISADGGIDKFSTDQLNLYVNTRAPSSEIQVEYEFELPGNNEILSISNNLVKLTHFLATPAVFKGGTAVEVYTAPFGDPYIYETYKYEVTLTASAEYDIHAYGKTGETTQDSRKTARFTATGLRDFPIVLSRNVPVTTLETPTGVRVTYIGAEEAAAFVDYSMEWAAEKIGPYPFSEFFVVKTALERNSGMEFSTMIFLDSSVFSNIETLKQLTYHEVFHQWYYGVIGTDPFNEPFIKEGLATYLAGHMVGRNFQGYANSGFLGMALSDYSSKTHYTSLVYNASAAWMAGLHRELDERFFDALKRMYEENQFDILYYDEFLSYFTSD